MKNKKRSPDSKRTNPPREVEESQKFLKDWERLSHSGKHDMHRLKEAMMLLIANDEPLPPEWRDHELLETKLEFHNVRECHVKGDLLLVYRIRDHTERSLITFLRAGTHSDIFR